MASGKKGKVVAASFTGKAKTMCMMIGMALTMFYNLPFELIGINVGYALIIIATIYQSLVLVSIITIQKIHLKQNKKRLKLFCFKKYLLKQVVMLKKWLNLLIEKK